jgi:hypothetical protein
MTARKRQSSVERAGALGLGCGHLGRFHRALISVVFSGNLAGFRPLHDTRVCVGRSSDTHAFAPKNIHSRMAGIVYPLAERAHEAAHLHQVLQPVVKELLRLDIVI